MCDVFKRLVSEMHLSTPLFPLMQLFHYQLFLVQELFGLSPLHISLFFHFYIKRTQSSFILRSALKIAEAVISCFELLFSWPHPSFFTFHRPTWTILVSQFFKLLKVKSSWASFLLNSGRWVWHSLYNHLLNSFKAQTGRGLLRRLLSKLLLKSELLESVSQPLDAYPEAVSEMMGLLAGSAQWWWPHPLQYVEGEPDRSREWWVRDREPCSQIKPPWGKHHQSKQNTTDESGILNKKWKHDWVAFLDLLGLRSSVMSADITKQFCF